MPVIEFTRDVGRRFKKGSVANLPTSTLKAMAKSDGVESFSDFSEVLALGARCIPFMKKRKESDLAGSVLRRNKAAPLKTGAATAKKKRGRPKKTVA